MSKILSFTKQIYHYIRFGRKSPIAKPAFFYNKSSQSNTACFILAGYKSFTWDIVFNRIKKFSPTNIDVCIVSSGMYSAELHNWAKKLNWSYVAMKQNNVAQALNSAISLFSSAKKIFKIDEDIFITEGFFETLPDAYEKASKDYFPAFSAPLIPINGFGYRILLEKLGLMQEYTSKFEYPKISAGAFMQIESNPNVAKFWWGEGGLVPQIDKLNRRVKENNDNKFSICPIRFSIGAIYFEKETLEKAGWFPVYNGIGMGIDEIFLCNLATSKSKVIVVSENQVVGHLSFGTQNQPMKEYFIKNKNLFEIND